MPYIDYQPKRFNSKSLVVIDTAEEIITEYSTAGYDLTLRQLYYQFVARDSFPDERRWTWTGKKWVRDSNGTKNADPNYKWLGSIVNDARLAGLINWESIVDRTRFIRENSHWRNPKDIIRSCAQQFRIDTRKTQEYYVEVWIEKDALIGVIEDTCKDYDVPCFSCRGYVSQSAMWEAAWSRFNRKERKGKKTCILHLGDHDPSGVDMTRDIQDRMKMFGSLVKVRRLALTMEQVLEIELPPNPAKLTDSRCRSYVDEYGNESWELDALEPDYIVNLISDRIEGLTNLSEWKKQKRIELGYRQEILGIVENMG